MLLKPLVDQLRQMFKGIGTNYMPVIPSRRDNRRAVLIARAVILGTLVPDGKHDQIRILGIVSIPLEECRDQLVVNGLLVYHTLAVFIHHKHGVTSHGEYS
ncbi:hypothetical protein D9M70_618160 [compost metagenome]